MPSSRAGRFIRAAALFLALGLSVRGAAGAFPRPDRIRYDGQCLTIDGRDVFIFSGSFHYFRCPPALWRERFRRIKAAGCNAVETYVPWNLHEPAAPAGLDDFSGVDLTLFRDWLRMAQDEFGFYTIIRPGPYICAEWDGGGIPRWLLARRPRTAAEPTRPWLRSADPVYLDWARHWMRAVCPVIADAQLTRRPPGRGGVILVQIENEYDGYKGVPDAERVEQLKALWEATQAAGIEVPIFTSWTKQCRGSTDPELRQVFDAVNAYPRFEIERTAKDLADFAAAQPDAPAMVAELQGGWFGEVGGRLSDDQPGLTAAQLTAHTLLAIQSGATVLNYYMIFGGTNFDHWAGRDITTSYDYDAPIREAGGVGDKYLALAAIGHMLQRYGADLARSHPLACDGESGHPTVEVGVRLARSGAYYVFFHNRSLAQAARGTAVLWLPRQGEIGLAYDLPAFGSRVLRLAADRPNSAAGEWLPAPVAGPRRPTGLPASVRVLSAQTCADPGDGPAGQPVALGAGRLLPESGIVEARPVVYETTVALPAQPGPGARLDLQPYADDSVVTEVNGRVMAADAQGRVDLAGALRTVPNRISVLYVQRGEANYGAKIEDEPGLRSATLFLPSAAGPTPRALTAWTLRPSLAGVARGWPALGPGALPGWTRIALDGTEAVPSRGARAPFPARSPGALAAWFRLEFRSPAAPAGTWVPWGARLDAAGDGELWLNGHSLGAIWDRGPQREYYLPECWLRPAGTDGPANVLTLVLAPTGGAAALRTVEICPYADQAEVRGGP